MLFHTFNFAVFFLVSFLVYWSLPTNRARKVFLILGSYAFYASWDWRFLGLLLISTAIDWIAGARIHAATTRQVQRAWMLFSVVTNLGILGYFKYCNFFIESAADLLSFLGFEPHLSTLRIILPVGISFYTFQTLTYSLDIFFGRLKPTKSLLDFAFFVAFFPQLVAGPIMRAHDFLPQAEEKRRWSQVDLRPCLIFFLIGFFKKACVSDLLAPYVDEYFGASSLVVSMGGTGGPGPATFDHFSAWIAMIYGVVQFYCDFSGYSDMAIGAAGLLGYQLCLNFQHPYFATSVGNFWRRWHISFTSFLRDYVYYPLGGARGTSTRLAVNLLVTWAIAGLWHGAAWTFVTWGFLSGVFLVVHALQRQFLRRRRRKEGAFAVLSIALTLFLFGVTGFLFRGLSMADAWHGVLAVFWIGEPGPNRVGGQHLLLPVLLLYLGHYASYRGWGERVWRRLPGWAFATAYGAMFAASIVFMETNNTPFIYFQW
ncbi:MAG: MBOAT family O-acyltransferase [Planctomycetota bacterium]